MRSTVPGMACDDSGLLVLTLFCGSYWSSVLIGGMLAIGRMPWLCLPLTPAGGWLVCAACEYARMRGFGAGKLPAGIAALPRRGGLPSTLAVRPVTVQSTPVWFGVSVIW